MKEQIRLRENIWDQVERAFQYKASQQVQSTVWIEVGDVLFDRVADRIRDRLLILDRRFQHDIPR